MAIAGASRRSGSGVPGVGTMKVLDRTERNGKGKDKADKGEKKAPAKTADKPKAAKKTSAKKKASPKEEA